MAPIKTRISTPVIKRFILTRWYSMTIIIRTVAEGWLLVNFTGWKRAHQKLKLVWNMVRTSSDTQISRTFGGFFKDKLQFQGLRFIVLINLHFLTPFDHPIGWNKSWSHSWFLLLRPSLITLFYTTFCNKTLQNDWVWLAIASEVQK